MKAKNTENTDSIDTVNLEQNNINLDVKIPKKRGRKPKNKDLLNENESKEPEEIKPKKKKRKKTKKYDGYSRSKNTKKER